MSQHSLSPTERMKLEAKLVVLEEEHRDLDSMVQKLSEATGADMLSVDQLALARAKKRKLALKDQINTVRSLLIPDIIA